MEELVSTIHTSDQEIDKKESKNHHHLPFCSDELNLIISFLSKDDLANFSLVCKEAKQVSYNSSTVWNELGPISIQNIEGLFNSERYHEGKLQKLHLTDENQLEVNRNLGKVFERLNCEFHIVDLTIEVKTGTFKFLTMKYLDRFENVTHLKILNDSFVIMSISNSMFIELPRKIEYLKIKGFKRGFRNCEFDRIFIQSEDIRIVKFQSSIGHYDMTFKVPDFDLKKLTKISFSGTTTISTDSFNDLMDKCTSLKQLDLSSTIFSDCVDFRIPRTMEFLNISNCSFDDNILNRMACLPNLKFVNLMSIPISSIANHILKHLFHVGRCIICEIASAEELITLDSIEHISFTRILPPDFERKVKEIKHSIPVEAEVCKLYYKQLF